MSSIVITAALAATSVVSSAYTYHASQFAAKQFHCALPSNSCQKHMQTLNLGVTAGCVITSVLCLWNCIILCIYLFKRSRYVEGVCIGASYNVCATHLIFSIFEHSTYPIVIIWGDTPTKSTFKNIFTLGYALAGIDWMWLLLLLLFKRKANSNTLPL